MSVTRDSKGEHPLWTYQQTVKFVEERFEKDVFFCYTIMADIVPFEFKVVFTTLAKLLWLFIAVYVSVTYFISDQETSFLSLVNGPGCKEVPIPLRGKFLLDVNGLWSGQDEHQDSTSYVHVEFSSLSATRTEFVEFMDSVTEILLNHSVASTSRDLAENLAYLMAWEYIRDTTNAAGVQHTHIIEFTADAAYVFNRYHQLGVLSNVDADCGEEVKINFDRSTAVVTGTLDSSRYQNTPNCSAVTSPTSLGYVSHLNGPSFRISFDMHSLIVAYAISNDLVTLDSFTLLNISSISNSLVTYGNDTYTIQVGMDEKYPGMDPVYCLFPTSRDSDMEYKFNSVCAIRVGYQFVFPFFHHAGLAGVYDYDVYTPKRCQCEDGSGMLDYCSKFDLVSGFLLFNEISMVKSMQKMLEMVYRYSPREINALSFNASFAARRMGGLASSYPHANASAADQSSLKLLSDPAWRASAYEFCGNCSFFTLQSFDDFDTRANEYSLMINNASCRDLFSSETSWDDVIPPSKIVEDFVKCLPAWQDSIINGTGIGVGISTIVVPFLVIVLMPILYTYLHYCQSEERKFALRQRMLDVATYGSTKLSPVNEMLMRGLEATARTESVRDSMATVSSSFRKTMAMIPLGNMGRVGPDEGGPVPSESREPGRVEQTEC